MSTAKIFRYIPDESNPLGPAVIDIQHLTEILHPQYEYDSMHRLSRLVIWGTCSHEPGNAPNFEDKIVVFNYEYTVNADNIVTSIGETVDLVNEDESETASYRTVMLYPDDANRWKFGYDVRHQVRCEIMGAILQAARDQEFTMSNVLQFFADSKAEMRDFLDLDTKAWHDWIAEASVITYPWLDTVMNEEWQNPEYSGLTCRDFMIEMLRFTPP